MDLSRRGFIGAGIALAATGAGGFTARGERRLRLGVLSDIHITDERATEPFEAVLRIFDRAKVDGVLVCGDLADYGVVPQLEAVARAWFRVFPDGKGADGRPVANLMHFGDHDTTGSTYRRCRPCVEMFPDEEAMKGVSIGRMDLAGRKAVWERCFREPWAPIVHKRVRGYDFVLAHFTRGEPGNAKGDNTPGLAEFLSGLKLDSKRPFFYSQHRVYRRTVGGEFLWGQEDGTTGALFAAKYPNVVAFCGHSHETGADDLNVWQDGFTAIQVPSLRYCVTRGGRENGFSLNDRGIRSPGYSMPEMGVGEGYDFTRQGYVVDVYDEGLVVSRREFKAGTRLGPDWHVPFAPKRDGRYPHPTRAGTVAAPRFPAEAAVAVARVRTKDRAGVEREMFELRFPTAGSTPSSPRAYDYEVCVEAAREDVVQTVASRRFFSRIIYGEASDREVVARIPVEDVPTDRLTRFAVRPVSAFGRRGGVICTEFSNIEQRG